MLRAQHAGGVKAHLWCSIGMWWCVGRGVFGAGDTKLQAWHDWHRNVWRHKWLTSYYMQRYG